MAILGGRAYTIELIHEVAELGYPFAEYSLIEPQQVLDQRRDLIDLQKAYGIYYLAHYPNEGSPRDAAALSKNFVPKIKRLLDLSQELEIRKGTIHFWLDNRWADKELLTKKIDLLSEMVAHAANRGIVLCIENLSERFDSFSPAFDTIPDLRMTLDIGHGQLLSKENTAINFIEHHFRKIAHVHVHDNHGGTSVKDDLHLPVGDGNIDYPRILGMLKKMGYNDTVTMEIKPGDMPRSKKILNRYL